MDFLHVPSPFLLCIQCVEVSQALLKLKDCISGTGRKEIHNNTYTTVQKLGVGKVFI